MKSIYIDRLETKVEKILNIFSKNLQDLDIIVIEMQIIGFKYKDYQIKDIRIALAFKALNMKNTKAYTLGGVAAEWIIKNNKTKVNYGLKNTEIAILRKYFYQQRKEYGELIKPEKKNLEIMSIDFNHHYLNQLRQKLPTIIKQKKIFNDLTIPGFYKIEFITKKHCEPILPTIKQGETVYTTGYGVGVYGYEEIDYFIQNGGIIVSSRPIVQYETLANTLKPFVKILFKVDSRKLRKGLANQFIGRLAQKTGRYKTKIIKKEEFKEEVTKTRRSKTYGNYILLEDIEITKTNNSKNTNIAGVLIIMARARIKVQKLIKTIRCHKGKILGINMDEILLDNKKTPSWLKKQKHREYKTKLLTSGEIYKINEQQGALLHKRQREARKSKTQPGHIKTPHFMVYENSKNYKPINEYSKSLLQRGIYDTILWAEAYKINGLELDLGDGDQELSVESIEDLITLDNPGGQLHYTMNQHDKIKVVYGTTTTENQINAYVGYLNKTYKIRLLNNKDIYNILTESYETCYKKQNGDNDFGKGKNSTQTIIADYLDTLSGGGTPFLPKKFYKGKDSTKFNGIKIKDSTENFNNAVIVFEQILKKLNKSKIMYPEDLDDIDIDTLIKVKDI